MITVPRAPAAMAMAAVPSLTVKPLPYADAKATNRKTAAAINTLGTVIMMVLSYFISVRIYKKKEF